ncbi:MAG: polysaccharide export protein [Armatimonadetes bacterium]|nr:polysaccharide export protein [Armatimonadota bacterium]
MTDLLCERRFANRAFSAVIGAIFVVVCAVFVCHSAQCLEATEYQLGPEDVIAVTVAGHPEMSTDDCNVPTDGAISVPRVGRIVATGLTLTQLTDTIATRLKSVLREPEVTVTLRTQRPQLVYVMGAVQRPGPYNVRPGWRATEAISAAGGSAPGIEPADCTVTILRASGENESVSLREATRGDRPNNPDIRPGDVVTVESAEMVSIYVMGKVNRPGLYNVRKDSAGVMEAIAVAGGAMPDAALTNIRVSHLNGEIETVSFAPSGPDGNQKNTLRLKNGDLVSVTDTIPRFAVLGWVNEPGFFSIAGDRPVRLSDALGMAKGVDNRRAGQSRIIVLRSSNGRQERLAFDYTKFLNRGDAAQNPQIQPDDVVLVPETGGPDWDRAVPRFSNALSILWILSRIGR